MGRGSRMFLVLKYALRQLAKSPAFTGVSVVMLALGIGMSTSTFSVTNGFLLSSMPFPESGRLVRIFGTSSQSQMMEHSPGNFLDIRAASLPSLSGIVGFVPHNTNVAELGQPPEQTYSISVTANFLTTLGIQPALGRGFAPDEDQPGKGSVVILTDAYWRRRFAGDPGIIGRTLRFGVGNVTVIGVLPPVFDKTLIWYGCGILNPLTVYSQWAPQRKDKWVSVFARLAPGAALASAQAELATLAARMDHDYPADNAIDGLRATGLASSFVDAGNRKLSWLVVGMALLVLVIACSNLASVQLARAFGRSHEFAVRSALGAGRMDLMGPLLVESVVITAAGAGAGLVLAHWANHLVAHYFTGNFEIAIDGRVLLFASFASLVTALTFGFAPAWLASRVSMGDALKEGSRGSTSSRFQRRLKLTLIVGQLAFAVVLVSAALSFALGVRNFLNRDMGWRKEGLVTGIVHIPYSIFREDAKKPVIVRALQDCLTRITGVSQASLASGVPLYGYPDTKKVVAEGGAPFPTGREPVAFITGVDAGYFSTLGISLKQGAVLPEHVKEGGPRVVVVNEAMARRFWPGQSAVGKRVRFTDKEGWYGVIGVVGDVSMASNFDAPATGLQVYWGLQEEGGIWYNFVLKSPLPAETLVQPIRKGVAAINSDLMVESVAGVPELLKSMLAGNILMIITLGSFALVGLLIAIVGLYGVVSQLTLQRTREIGIRMALGADDSAVVRMILAQGAVLLACGVAVGLLGALGVGAIYRQTMPGLHLPSLGLHAAITALLCAAGFAACYLPARRAGRTDPVAALRAD